MGPKIEYLLPKLQYSQFEGLPLLFRSVNYPTSLEVNTAIPAQGGQKGSILLSGEGRSAQISLPTQPPCKVTMRFSNVQY